jgi:branched-chain amino acid transport system permease protein
MERLPLARLAARDRLLLVLLVALLAFPVLVSNAFLLGIFTMMLFWAAAASAWNISGGYAGQFSLGHAAFFGIGAYTSTLLFTKAGISPWIGMLAGAGIATAFALLLAAVTMRLRGSFFVMSTLAAGAVLHILAINQRGLTSGTQGIVIPLSPAPGSMVFQDKAGYAYLAIGLATAVYLVARWIEASRFGYSLIAYRENDDAARALGIRTLRARILAFCLSAALTAITGTFHAQYFLYIDPDGVFSLTFSLQVALIAIVGGLGTALGPVVGALVVTPLGLMLQSYVGNAVPGLHLFVYASIVMLVLLLLPEGVGPAIAARWARRRTVNRGDA